MQGMMGFASFYPSYEATTPHSHDAMRYPRHCELSTGPRADPPLM
jgi:hypothetical protein